MLDDIDLKILDTLQRNGRTKRAELAATVHLSVPSVSERLRKLEDQNIITGYHATVDYKRLGKDITAFVFVTVDSSKHYSQFIDHAVALDDVLECHAITGEGSHLLKVRVANMSRLERLLSEIQSWQGVTGTKTTYVLSTVKETFEINV